MNIVLLFVASRTAFCCDPHCSHVCCLLYFSSSLPPFFAPSPSPPPTQKTNTLLTAKRRHKITMIVHDRIDTENRSETEISELAREAINSGLPEEYRDEPAETVEVVGES